MQLDVSIKGLRSRILVFRDKFVPGLDIQPEQSENNNRALKEAAAGCSTFQVMHRFFLSIDKTPWLSG